MLRLGLMFACLTALTASPCLAEDWTTRKPQTGQEWLDYLKSQPAQSTPIKNKPTSFGARVRTSRSSGGYFSLQVTQVTDGTPATRLKLPPNLTASYRLVPYRDYIVKVDGTSVHTPDDLWAGLRAADDWAKLRVYDSHTKQYGNYYVKIR